jgi:hypothetical protein
MEESTETKETVQEIVTPEGLFQLLKYFKNSFLQFQVTYFRFVWLADVAYAFRSGW